MEAAHRPFSDLKSRGRSNDPPDCEALDRAGRRVAIEVTELVDADAIRHAKRHRRFLDWGEWDRDRFLTRLHERLSAKDDRYPALKDPPYPGGYVVVVHSDEPLLNRATIAEYLSGAQLAIPQHITQAFLLLSYDPSIQGCPYFELTFG